MGRDGVKISSSVKMVRQAPLSMECSRQEYWSGLPFPTQGIFPIQGLNPRLLHLLYCRQILYYSTSSQRETERLRNRPRANVSFSSRARTEPWALVSSWTPCSSSVFLCTSGASSHLELTHVQSWAATEGSGYKPHLPVFSPQAAVFFYLTCPASYFTLSAV